MKNVSTLLIIALVATVTLCAGFRKEGISTHTKNFTNPNIKIVMLGDSETRRINHYWGSDTNWNTLMGFDTMINYGFDAIGTWHLFEWHLLDEAIAMNPDLLCIQIGMYDALQNVPLTITLNNYRKIIDTVQAHGIDLLMQSTIPTTSYYDTLYGGFPSNGITANRSRIINDSLKLICQQRNVPFLDIRPRLVTDAVLRNGTTYQLQNKTIDGIHINYAGYEVWKGHLMQFLLNNGYLN